MKHSTIFFVGLLLTGLFSCAKEKKQTADNPNEVERLMQIIYKLEDSIDYLRNDNIMKEVNMEAMQADLDSCEYWLNYLTEPY